MHIELLLVLAIALVALGLLTGYRWGVRTEIRRRHHALGTEWMKQSVELELPSEDFQRIYNMHFAKNIQIGLARADRLIIKTTNCVHKDVPFSSVFSNNGQATASASAQQPSPKR